MPRTTNASKSQSANPTIDGKCDSIQLPLPARTGSAARVVQDELEGQQSSGRPGILPKATTIKDIATSCLLGISVCVSPTMAPGM